MSTLQVTSFNMPLAIELPTIATDQDFINFCLANRALRIERTVQGKIIVTPLAFSDTGASNFKLAVEVGKWIDRDGTGIGFDSSTGFTLPNGATRSPDISWIRLERWNALTPEQQKSFAPICPDFVIELRSASDTLKSLQEKMQEYLDNGLQLGFLIDRKNKTVYIYRPEQPIEILQNPDVVNAEPELPGLALVMAKIW
ncbi:MAG: Uma2 family endonuclease [Cyanobacteria bacterium P01_B01_bin.77]